MQLHKCSNVVIITFVCKNALVAIVVFSIKHAQTLTNYHAL